MERMQKMGALWLCLALSTLAAAGSPPDAARQMESTMSQEQRPDAAGAKALVKAGAVLVDVRSQEEWGEGHVKGALFLPVREVESKAASKLPDKNAPIVTYCRVGSRAELAAKTLRMLGYTHVTAMTGGFEDLKAAGLPTE